MSRRSDQTAWAKGSHQSRFHGRASGFPEIGRNRPIGPFRTFLVAGLVVSLFSSCSLIDVKIESDSEPLTAAERQLRFETRALGEAHFLALHESLDVLREDPSTSALTLERALVWKLQSSAAIQQAAFQPVPWAALIDTWVHIRRIDDYCRSDRSSEWFREGVEAVCGPMPELHGRVQKLATIYLPGDALGPARQFVEDFAAAHPIQSGDFRLRGAFAEAKEKPGLHDLGSELNPGSFPDALSDLSDRVGLVSTHGVARIGTQAELAGVRMQSESQQIAEALEDVRGAAARIRRLVAENPDVARDVARAFSTELEPLLIRLETSSEQALQQLSREREAVISALDQEMARLTDTFETERQALVSEVGAIVASTNRHWAAWAEQMIGRLFWFGLVGFIVVMGLPLLIGFWLGRHLPRKRND
jgi:CRP-like cAMP-binding protein